MIVLTIRTDKPEAELGLYQGNMQLAYHGWQAHRELGRTIHLKLKELLDSKGYTLHDLQSIVAYQGPGSFTGLRIGLTVANTLASALVVPIVGSTGDDWQAAGLVQLADGKNDKVVLPEYGAPVHITTPKK